MKVFSTALTSGVLAFAAICIASPSSAHALLFFEDQININLSTIDSDFEDATLIERLDFDGVLAINGTNSPLSPGAEDGTTGLGQDGTSPFAGVTIRVVGFADNVDGERDGGQNFDGLGDTAEFGHSASFEVTAVIRDWSSNTISVDASDPTEVEVTVTYETGFIDLYLDTAGNFSSTDAALSADGILLGTFAIVQVQAPSAGTEPSTKFTYDSTLGVLNGSGTTSAVLQLVSAASDNLFTTTDGQNLLGGQLVLFTLTVSRENVVADSPALTNIFGGGDPVDVGAGFDPATANTGAGFTNSNFPNDVVSTFDSANTFAVVPEPTSIALLAIGVFGAGLTRVRRRKQCVGA